LIPMPIRRPRKDPRPALKEAFVSLPVSASPITAPAKGPMIIPSGGKKNNPRIKPIHSKNPTIIGKGVATIGTISNGMFFIGKKGLEHEQALAVNVEGKGIVLIVGCGHQTLPKILARTEMLFDAPLYGIIGGLHYPVEGGPISIMGMSPYKHSGTGKVPWRHISREEVKENIELLKKRNPRIAPIKARHIPNVIQSCC